VVRRILHVDLDAFFVAVEQARDPALQGKAVVVGGDPSGRGVVSTASYEARRFGVQSGMALRTAKRLAPHAIFVRGDFMEYARVSKIFHAILADFTPLVHSGGVDEAYLDVTGCEAIGGTAIEIGTAIRARVRTECGIAASVGIASSPLVAKVASDSAKPDGLLEVPAGTEAAFLAPMPLRALPSLGASMERRLAQMGLKTLGQLAAMPAETLDALFGHHGHLIAVRARGIDPTPIAEREAVQKSISREGTFSADVADPAHLRAVLRGFCESVGAQLREQGSRGRTVTVKVRFGDFTTLTRNATPRRPVASDDAIFEAAEALFEKVRRQDPRGIRLIGVGVSNFVDAAMQLTLEPSVAEREEHMSELFDRVRRKYGRRSLQTGRTAFDAATGSDDWRHERNLGISSQMR
jgi:DNA polymerase-4